MASSSPSPDAPGVEDLTYEQARAELVSTVAALEAGEGTLEESIASWERGQALATRCQALLDNARERLEEASSQAAPTAPDSVSTGEETP